MFIKKYFFNLVNKILLRNKIPYKIIDFEKLNEIIKKH